MWTEEHRRRYRREGEGYPSDLRDAEWARSMASGAIWAELHMALRERIGREASPSAAVLDSQSIKSAEKGAAKTAKVGYDRQQAGQGP
jgi:hypothetical protein